jgi:hypothetical protein
MGVRKDETQVIDVQAVKWFEQRFNDINWTTTEIVPDVVGLDRRIELVEEGKHTALSAFVQIKGKRKAARSKGRKTGFPYVSQRLEVEHLEYYSRMTEPVFLVVVDLDKRDGYWIFIQRYIREGIRGTDWRSRISNERGKKPEIMIPVPFSNRLSEVNKFREAIKDSIGYMAKVAILTGIAYGQDTLRKLDPRFDIRITATTQGEAVEMIALEDLRVDLKFGTEFSASGKLGDLIGRGVPVPIGPGDVTAEGSLLIRSIMEETADRKGFLQLCLSGSGHVRLTHLDNQGRAVGQPHELECVYQGGLEEVRFLARTLYNNLVLSGVCSSKPETPTRSDIAYDLGCWLGRPLATLPNFDLINDLLVNLADGDRMNVECFAEAHPVFSGYMLWKKDEMESFLRLLGMVDLIGKARWIARTFGVDAKLPRQITSEHVQEIMRVYRLAQGEQIRLKGAVQSASAQLPRINAETVWKIIGLDGVPFRLALVSDGPQSFLGLEVPLGPVETQLTHMRLGGDTETLSRLIREGTTPISVTWEPTAETEIIIEKATDELLALYEARAAAQECSE